MTFFTGLGLPTFTGTASSSATVNNLLVPIKDSSTGSISYATLATMLGSNPFPSSATLFSLPGSAVSNDLQVVYRITAGTLTPYVTSSAAICYYVQTLMAVSPSLSVAAPANLTTATLYSASGSYSSYGTVTPVINISVDSGTFSAVPAAMVTGGNITANLPGLSAGTHTLQLKDGNGLPSATVSYTVAGSPPVPAQVVGLVAGTITGTSAVLSWTLPTSGGAPTGYSIAYTPSGGATSTVTTASVANSYSLTGLTVSTTYSVTVSATNVTGTGTASTAINITTLSS